MSVNACAGPFGAVYDFFFERERAARVYARVLWGVDTQILYDSIRAELDRVPAGATVVDAPCGGGVAFRGIQPGREVRYHALDLDEAMVKRARRRATQRGLERVECAQGDMLDLPFADGSVDLALSYSGLHMIGDPDGALAALARCVKPGGRVAGTTFLCDGPLRQRVILGLGGRTGHAVPAYSASALEAALSSVGLESIEVAPRSGFVRFSARKPGRQVLQI